MVFFFLQNIHCSQLRSGSCEIFKRREKCTCSELKFELTLPLAEVGTEYFQNTECVSHFNMFVQSLASIMLAVLKTGHAIACVV
uniref:Uncharacterized protein n=1 Tax=Anguilla anguilla TaxID=7936 RepID=A0A0E9WVS5_ANGAN